MYYEHLRETRSLRNGREIFCAVIRQRTHHDRIDRERCSSEKQCAAVGRRLGDECGSDHRAATAAILDHDALPEFFAELLSNDAALRVGWAAGGVGDHEP